MEGRGTVSGIAARGTYVPSWRMDRAALGTMFGVPGGRGLRSVVGPDEDARHDGG